ncbi:MAG: hypothetical protein J6V38_05865 [Kiritimatiellae bacterium]|nr:hypothetical protein [Kiritimatiellia bacterium]
MESKLKIIDTSDHELLNDPVFLYKMTRGKTTVSVNKLDDDQLDNDFSVSAWLIYTDVNSKGEDVEILSVLTESGLVLAAQSKTFKESFFDIVDIVGDRPFSIRVLSGTSKSGRRYMDCDLASIG